MKRALALLVASSAIVACNSAPEPAGIEITEAWSRATPPGATTGAGYFTVTNHGPHEDRLIGVGSPIAAGVELHESSVDANGMAHMRPLESVPLPVGDEVRFEPEGKHLMFVDLRQPLAADERVPITLRFEHAPAQTIQLAVQPLGSDAPGAHEHH